MVKKPLKGEPSPEDKKKAEQTPQKLTRISFTNAMTQLGISKVELMTHINRLGLDYSNKPQEGGWGMSIDGFNKLRGRLRPQEVFEEIRAKKAGKDSKSTGR